MTNQNKEYTMFDTEEFKKLILERKKLDNFDDFDDDVNNSIVLSYIQKLNFKDYKTPPFFMNFQKELKEYEQSSYTDEKLIDFLKNI